MKLRRKASILAFQALYAWDLQTLSGLQPDIEQILTFSWNSGQKLSGFDEEILVFARFVFTACIEKQAEIDAAIKNKLINWDFGRLNAADRAVLRFGAYLLLFQKEIAPALVIEEALKLCGEFSSGDSPGFVHGILDALTKPPAG